MSTLELVAARIDKLTDAVDRLEERVAFFDKFDIPLNRLQSASFLGCSPRTIDNYRRRGMLTPFEKDGIIGYRLVELKKIKG